MSGAPQRRYRFASKAQWAAGLSTRVDNDAFDALGGMAPFAPYGPLSQLWPSQGAAAPTAARDGRLFWHDDHGALHCLDAEHDHASVRPGPAALAKARRIVAWSDNLWLAAAAPHSLQCYDADCLARRFSVDLGADQVLDLASDGRDGIWALTDNKGTPHCIHVDCAGYVLTRFALADIARPVKLTYLARSERLVVLAADGQGLHWFAPGTSRAEFTIDLNALRPCFRATELASDGRSRIVAAGAEHEAFGGGALVLSIDADGAALGATTLAAPFTGVHATRDSLLVTGADGLLRYAPAPDAMLVAASEASCVFMTPVLQSPLGENPRRWLRAEAGVTLGPGASVEISYASSADPELHEQALALFLAAGTRGSAAQRQARLHALLRDWSAPMVLRGADGQAAAQTMQLAVPLFDVRHPWLWVSVTLVAAPGAPLPVLHQLDVLYPGLSLMEHLPSLYQRAEAEPGNFLRALVGVIETNTQELDARIAAMGSKIDPATAPVAWLDYVARWLDLPWDDALSEDQKRRLLQRAHALSAQRGTRAGLATLLEALLPDQPGRYRIVDVNAQHGFATLGASALPSVLAGLPRTALALNRKAILGRGRLTCPERPPDQLARLLGQVTVDIVAAAHERRAWEPWLERMLAAVTPVTARLRVRWISPAAALLDDHLGDSLVLRGPLAPRLGTSAVTGLARLASDRPRSLSALGVEAGVRLR
jgi:phage tail-like protein